MGARMIRKGLAVAVILLFVGMSVVPSTGTIIKEPYRQIASGNTLYVGGSGPNNYTRIQDAIDNSSHGDTVFVYDDSSPYYENVVIDISIQLFGENKETTIINGGDIGDVIVVTADQVIISGFTIEDSGEDYSNHDAGIKLNSNENSFCHLQIEIISLTTPSIIIEMQYVYMILRKKISSLEIPLRLGVLNLGCTLRTVMVI